MTYKTITEGNASIITYPGKISKKLPVFYNPVMKFNRDTSVLLLKSIDENSLQIADPMAGSGVRPIRFIQELGSEKIRDIAINDYSEAAVKLIKKNLKKNKRDINNITPRKITVTQLDANEFLMGSKGFDYIDVDPFGSPNPYLDSAIKRLSRRGILAVTATDTSALAGTYPHACMRKYWAVPLRNELKHEIGLRILIRKVQLIGAQYDKALSPIFSYSKDHYYRIYFRIEKGKRKCAEIIKSHRRFYYNTKTMGQSVDFREGWQEAGPIWTGQLFDGKLVKDMGGNCKEKDTKKFLEIVRLESEHEGVGFIDLHTLAKMNKLKAVKTRDIIDGLKDRGYAAYPTHFSACAVKTNAPVEEITLLFSLHQ